MKSLTETVQLSSGASIPRFGFGSPKPAQTHDGVTAAYRVGYRHFDTAQLYGNEAEVASALASCGAPRSEIYLTTKWCPPGHPAGGEPPAAPYEEPGLPVDDIYNEMLRSRAIFEPTLGHIDLMLLHASRPGPQARARAWEALGRAQTEGWVKSIGVSNFNEHHLAQLPGPTPAVNQIELHPWCQQRPIVKYCADHGIQVVAFCPIVRGSQKRLTDPVAVRVAEKHGKSVVQVILRWSVQKGYIPIPMSSSPDRIRSNADIVDFTLDDDDMAQLDGLDCGDAGACSMNMIHGP